MNTIQQTIFYLFIFSLNFSLPIAGITRQQPTLNTAPLQLKGQTYPSIKGPTVTCIYQSAKTGSQIQCADNTAYYSGTSDHSQDIFLMATQAQLNAFQGTILSPLIASHYLGNFGGIFFFVFPPNSIGYNFWLHSNRPAEINILNVTALNTQPLRLGNKQYTSIKQPTVSCAVNYQNQNTTQRQWQIACDDGSYYHTEEETISTTDVLEPKTTIAVVQDPAQAPLGFNNYLGSFHVPTAAQTFYVFVNS